MQQEQTVNAMTQEQKVEVQVEVQVVATTCFEVDKQVDSYQTPSKLQQIKKQHAHVCMQ